MHELSVCQALLRQAESIAQARGAARIATISVRLGPLSGVEADLLETLYPIARRGLRLAGEARLIIERAPVRVLCRTCGAETRVLPNQLRCGYCNGEGTQLVGGDECLLVSIDLITDPCPSPFP